MIVAKRFRFKQAANKSVVIFLCKQSNWIQTSKTGGQLCSDTSPYKEIEYFLVNQSPSMTWELAGRTSKVAVSDLL